MDDLLISHIRDTEVDAQLDGELRELLALCFPADSFFRLQRFNHRLPEHRFLFRQGRLAAHLALHDLELAVGETVVRIGGVAEVAVHPDYRGRRLARKLLSAAHQFLIGQGVEFSVLFGKPELYSSSGYRLIEDPIRYFDERERAFKMEPLDYAMVRPLGARPWPLGLVDLKGPTF